MDKDRMQQYVGWFREASPYIHRFRGETFVIVFDGDLVRDGRLAHLAHDIALLVSLGIHVVIVHGASPQIDAALERMDLPTERVGGRRITERKALAPLMEAVGAVRIEIEAALSQGTDATPMAGARLRVVSGNFVIGRPIGVIDGIDFQYTGTVRRIESEAIRRHLDSGDLVLLSPVAFSPTGEIFNVLATEVAARTAVGLSASKIIVLGKSPEIRNRQGELLRQITLNDAQKMRPVAPMTDLLTACEQGVSRIHLVDRDRDGALLLELFSRDGVGTLISKDPFEHIRPATLDDLVEILGIIRPLEDGGVLVRRPMERIEMELAKFVVTERDRSVIGCVALYPYAEDGMAEMACLAIVPEYQREGRGDQLLAWCQKETRKMGLNRLFVLTTQSSHWFLERGFRLAELDDLPSLRKTLYNGDRKSQILIKDLKG
jgi:amino-acid N-acetyltransferase